MTDHDEVDFLNETGLGEHNCYFGLSFKEVRLTGDKSIWIVNSEYDADKMYHTHPFFYNYHPYLKTLGTVYKAKPDIKSTVDDFKTSNASLVE